MFVFLLVFIAECMGILHNIKKIRIFNHSNMSFSMEITEWLVIQTLLITNAYISVVMTCMLVDELEKMLININYYLFHENE